MASAGARSARRQRRPVITEARGRTQGARWGGGFTLALARPADCFAMDSREPLGATLAGRPARNELGARRWARSLGPAEALCPAGAR